MSSRSTELVDWHHAVELLYGTSYASYITPNIPASVRLPQPLLEQLLKPSQHLFYQGFSGYLYEAMYPREPSWSAEKILSEGVAKLFTPLACTAARSQSSSVGLYDLSPTFSLCNLVFENGKWVQGHSQGIKTAPCSQLSVVTWNNGGSTP